MSGNDTEFKNTLNFLSEWKLFVQENKFKLPLEFLAIACFRNYSVVQFYWLKNVHQDVIHALLESDQVLQCPLHDLNGKVL